MTGANLLGIPETLLPADPQVDAALAGSDGSLESLQAIVRSHPDSSLVWALLSDAAARGGDDVPAYAYARVGYHRGLDSLRKAGWRGQGPIPWSHEPNRGVLRALYALRRSADAIGESPEVDRLTQFLDDSDPSAVAAIESEA